MKQISFGQLIIFILFYFFNAAFSFASSRKNCESLLQNEFLNFNSHLYDEYASIKVTATVPPEKRAFWIPGRREVSKALFLVHGYMGSPGEMAYLAKPFLKAGWTVVGFLIPGHGSDYEVANNYNMTRATQDLEAQLKSVLDCFDEVSAVGFSTGGFLLHQYLLNNDAPPRFKSVHFISPLFRKRYGSFWDPMITFAYDGISVKSAYAATRFRDLKVMVADPQHYHENVPMRAGLDIVKTALAVSKMRAPSKIKVPAQLFVTDGDLSVDIHEAQRIIFRDYKNVDLTWYRDSSPHHLMAPAVSPHAEDVRNRIFLSISQGR